MRTPQEQQALLDALRLSSARRMVTHKPCPERCMCGYVETGATDWHGGPETKPCPNEECEQGFVRKSYDEFAATPLRDNWPVSLSPMQKLKALDHRFYGRQPWEPKAGDLYTTSRADLELYEVVAIEDGHVVTRYRDPSQKSAPPARWPVEEFLSPETFGYARVHVPRWVFYYGF